MTNNLADYFESLNHALSANEVSKLLGIRRDTVYAYAKAGELPSFNIGKTKTMLRFDPKVLAEWLRERQSYILRIPHP
jgi:excisionase family DNA binding protein